MSGAHGTTEAGATRTMPNAPECAHSREHLHRCEVDNDPYRSMYWVAMPNETSTCAVPTCDPTPPPPGGTPSPSDPDNTSSQAQRGSERPLPRYVGNLTNALARAASRTVGHATTKASQYADLMMAELPTADKDTNSNAWRMLKSGKISRKELTTALRAKWGGIYTAKIAARMGRPYLVPTRGPGMCPLCGMQDGATHILGECLAHKHLHIERHNKVGRCIMKHIRRGQYGAYPMYADVGKEPDLQSDFDVTSKTLPAALVPPASTSEPMHRHQPTKFDIVILHTDHAAASRPTSTWRDIPARTEITAVEIGFRSDYDKGRKILQKQQQHMHTCTRLRRHYALDYQIWDIGYTGMIPARARAYAKKLGVPDAERLLHDVQAVAIRYAHIIMQNRRQQERNTGQQGSQAGAHTQNAASFTERYCGTTSRSVRVRTTEETSQYRHRPIGQKRTRAPPR